MTAKESCAGSTELSIVTMKIRKTTSTLVLTPLLVLFLAFSASAQQALPAHECGTHFEDDDLAWLRSYQADPAAYWAQLEAMGATRSSGGDWLVPVKVHIVGNDDGGGYYRLSNLMTVFCEVNEQFDTTGMHFYIRGDINYIDNSDYYAHDFFNGGQMMLENNNGNMVNMYFVDDPAGNCGYFAPFPDGIALAKTCSNPGNSTIAHELGHYFSLPHTFSGWEGGAPPVSQQEKVDGSNCGFAGDGFCDTRPDYAAYRWNCPTTGPFTDPDGVEFIPDGSFIMSYSNDACAVRFSEEQRGAMRANLQGTRSGHLTWPEPTLLTHEPVELVEPEADAEDTPPNYTVLKWTADPNATSYHLTVSLNPAATASAVDMLVTDTFFIATEEHLVTDRNYYWRVKPVSVGNTCTEYTPLQKFKTGLFFTNVAEADSPLETVTLYPNPVGAGQSVRVELDSRSNFQAAVSMIDASGRQVNIRAEQLLSGKNTIDLSTEGLAAGLYLIRVESLDGDVQLAHTEKIWVTR